MSGVGLNAFATNFMQSYGAVKSWRKQDEEWKQQQEEQKALADAAQGSRSAFVTGYEKSSPYALLAGEGQPDMVQPPAPQAPPGAPQQVQALPTSGSSAAPPAQAAPAQQAAPAPSTQAPTGLPVPGATGDKKEAAAAPAGLPVPPLPGTEKKEAPPAQPQVQSLPDASTPQAAAEAAHPLVQTAVNGLKFPTGGMSDTYYQNALKFYDAAGKGGPRAAQFLQMANAYAEQANEQRTREFGQTMYAQYQQNGVEGLQTYLNSFGKGSRAKFEAITEGPNKGGIRAAWGKEPARDFASPEEMIGSISTMMSGDPNRIAKMVNDNADNANARNQWFYYQKNAEMQNELNGIWRRAQADEAAAQAEGRRLDADRARSTLNLVGELGQYSRNPEHYMPEIQRLTTQLGQLDPKAITYVNTVDPQTGQVTQMAHNRYWDDFMSLANNNRALLYDPRIAKPRADGAPPTVDPQTGRLVDATDSMVTVRRRTNKRTGKVETFYWVDGSPKYFITARAAHDEALEVAARRKKQPAGGAASSAAPAAPRQTALPQASAEFGD